MGTCTLNFLGPTLLNRSFLSRAVQDLFGTGYTSRVESQTGADQASGQVTGTGLAWNTGWS